LFHAIYLLTSFLSYLVIFNVVIYVNIILFTFLFIAVKSGDYYMFDEPDSESINLVEKSHESQVPDPVGEELDKLASIRGLTAVRVQWKSIFQNRLIIFLF
jgi:hypothetical protein